MSDSTQEVPVTDESTTEVPVADVDPSAVASAPDTSTSSAALAASEVPASPVLSADTVSAHVDPTGQDPTKNDEVPSLRDGRTREDVTYGDGICPLLGEGAKARKTAEVGGYEVTVHQPYRVLTDPVECPTCKKQVESPQLTWDMSAGGGYRDCPQAMSLRAHPVSKEAQAALDGGEYAKAERITDRHPLRDQFLRLLGFRRKVTS